MARGESWRPRPEIVGLVLALAAPTATALPFTVTVQRIEAEGIAVSGFEARADKGTVALQAQRVQLPGGWDIADAGVDCRLGSDFVEAPCTGAAWSFSLGRAGSDPRIPLNGTLGTIARAPGHWEASTQFNFGPLVAELGIHAEGPSLAARLSWKRQALSGLRDLPLPASAADWIQDGQSSGILTWERAGERPAQIGYRVWGENLAFDSPDGRFAGGGLAFDLAGSIQPAAETAIEVAADITAGELLADRFYVAFDDIGVHLEATATSAGRELRIHSVRVRDDRSIKLEARGRLNLDAPLEKFEYQIGRLELRFPEAYRRYFEALLAPATLDGLTVTGSVLWQGGGRGLEFPEGVLDVLDLSVVDRDRGRFAITGITARLRSGESPTDSRIAWRGLLLRRINLGAGEMRVRTGPGLFELARPLQLEVLGGRFSLDRLRVSVPRADMDPEIGLKASLADLEMAELTAALDWPRFEGRISGTIPGINLESGILTVGGVIEVDVFDGQITLSGLRIERLFGVLPSLAADLEVRNLDLTKLTQVFSFGQISGRLDGYMRGLRMLDWKPAAFDAWFGTPAGQGRTHAISRQAVNRLTNIGGGGAASALSGPVMSLFSNFSYRRLGLGCRLQNDVCELYGLDEDENSVLILEGAGIPKIMIRAYNRQMDFPQLVANLAAASAGEGMRIGEGD